MKLPEWCEAANNLLQLGCLAASQPELGRQYRPITDSSLAYEPNSKSFKLRNRRRDDGEGAVHLVGSVGIDERLR